MKKFKISWVIENISSIEVSAEDEKDAQRKFDEGDFTKEEFNTINNEDYEVDINTIEIKELKNEPTSKEGN